MNPLIEGAIIGSTLAVLLGPALFALVQTSINRGFGSGVSMAVGIFLSDVTLVFLCYIGAMQIISDDQDNQLVFGIIAGAILIIYGIVAFSKQVKIDGESNNSNGLSNPGWFTFLLKGYFLNVANPYVWVIWITITVGVTTDYGDNDIRSATLFFAGVLFIILITDIIKAYVAKKIKSLLNEKIIGRLNKIVGVLLFAFGVVLIIRTVMEYYEVIDNPTF
jgi:threonine/homoserine/homoserine lactone efflux protein